MFILVNPNNYVLIRITNSCTPVITNKERVIKCEEEKATAYLLDEGLLYPKTLPIKMYEVNNIPSKVKPYEYLYIEGEFVLNKNYGKPEDYTSEIKNIENQLDVLHTIVDNKMNIDDPEGTGSFSMNRKANSTIGDYSTVLGYNTTASGVNSYAEGNNTLALSDYQHVQGKFNVADTSNKYAHIVGGGTADNDRKNIHTIDWDGNAEFAGDVIATDEEGNTISLLELANNSGSVSGDYLSSENPVGTGTFSMNRKANTTIGQYSHAEGYDTTASGRYSHAEGNTTTASGFYGAHAEGSGTVAAGDYSHAEGTGSKANSNCSHAEGSNTIANGYASHAEGYITIAGGQYSHVQGKFNVEDTENKYAHIVGGGTSSSDRKNIHTIDWNGNAEFAGDVTISGNLIQNGNNVLDVSNYFNYAATKDHTHDEYLPLSGGTVTGTVRFASISSYYIDSDANASFANIKQNGNNVLDISNYSNYAATKDHAHSGYSLTNHTHSYLPLSGGTLTGQLNYGSSTYYTTSTGVSKFNTTTVVKINIGSTSDNQVYSYLYHALYLGSSTTYWINQKGNVCFNDMTVVGETTFGGGVTIVTAGLTIGATSILNSVFNLGSENASDGYRYYINGNATGRFKSLRYASSQALSSKRYKNDIEYKDFEFWHNSLMLIKPCTFYYKNDKETKHIGLIAEDLYELIPELVDIDDEGKPTSIEYANLTIPLIGEVQRLNSIINKQQDTIDDLKSIIDLYLK